MNKMVPGLNGNKMSASDPDSKVDLLDGRKAVQKKINKAFCEEGTVEGNGVLAFAESVLFPTSELRTGAPQFVLLRPEEYGGNMTYTSFEDLQRDYADKKVFPGDLKTSVAAAINELLDPIREHFESPEMQQLLLDAYPPPKAAPKKVKQSKKHNRRPDVVPADVTAPEVIEEKLAQAQI
ncbi:Tyrosine--tRNA ligase cytoplasmic [Coemansia sp. RSA 2702]|nr:Tyrosine--tRNA ligase cytoplasmic [Coemansia sp. RSA 2702]